MQQVNGTELMNMFGAGAAWLERNAPQVNALNVFPVPDGDTGTNMLLTMQAAMSEAYGNPSANAGEVSALLSYGALLGARGNSGVILSQIMRGFAKSIDKRETIDAKMFADALLEASRTAYNGVVKPVEGTILTVIREAADRAVVAATQSDDICFVLGETSAAARLAVEQTPQLLPILKEAGVVDAGAEGLALIFEGARKYLDGESIDQIQVTTGAHNLTALAREDGFGYDIQFHIRGQDLNVPAIREKIAAMGESALIVGDEALVKVHVHAPNPGDIIKYGAEQGALVNIIIENMQEQYEDFKAGGTADKRNGAENLGGLARERTKHAAPSTEDVTGIATVAVASGEGLRRIFESNGVSALVNGGPTMNPSAQDILEAIEKVNANQVIVLPNDKNVVLAANQAKELSGKRVEVIPTRTTPQGLAALLAFNYQADLSRNVQSMADTLNWIRTVELTHAVRSVQFNGITISAGQPIALLDGELVASGDDLNGLLRQVLHLAGAEDSELVTIYYGAEIQTQDAQNLLKEVEQEFSEQEIELHWGGQPLDPYIISVE